jgi:hypothetical protein
MVTLLVSGFVGGVLAGVIMAAVSHAGKILNLFNSSLIEIDGSFVLGRLGLSPTKGAVLLAGTIMHLVTSGVFGAIYLLVTRLMGWEATSGLLVAIYFFILYVSMLFIALPAAGQGILGRNAGPYTWLDQLVLHVIFGFFYFIFAGFW